MDLEIHNIQTIEEARERFDLLGHSVKEDFFKIQSFIDTKISAIRSIYNTLSSRVNEAERRLDNANAELHLARISFEINKEGKRMPKNTRPAERKVAQCQAGLNSARKNLQTFEEPYRYINNMVSSYQADFDRVEYNFTTYPVNIAQALWSVIQIFNEYTEFSNDKI